MSEEQQQLISVPDAAPETPLSRMLSRAQTFAEILDAAKLLASSNFVPAAYRGHPGDIIAAFELGSSLGLPPMVSLQWIAVVNGRPAIWGDGLLAIVYARGGRIDEGRILDADDQFVGYECRAHRQGRPAVVRRFTLADADRAGLLREKRATPWQTYPERMCQMRARGFACRDQYADWLSGVVIQEEAADSDPRVIEVDTSTGQVVRDSGSRSETLARQLRSGGAETNPEASQSDETLAEAITAYERARHESDLVRADRRASEVSGRVDDLQRAALRDAATGARDRIRTPVFVRVIEEECDTVSQLDEALEEMRAKLGPEGRRALEAAATARREQMTQSERGDHDEVV